MKNKFLKLTTLPLVSTIVLTPIIATSITSCSKDKQDVNPSDYIGNADGSNWKGVKSGTNSCTLEFNDDYTATIKNSYGGFEAHNFVLPDYVENNGKKYKLTKISTGAFHQRMKLTGTLTLNNFIENIGSPSTSGGVFGNCDNITGELIIPYSVKFIQAEAFTSCDKLESIVFKNNENLVISSSVFSSCSGIKNISFQNNITFSANSVFVSCTSLENITYSDNAIVTINAPQIFKQCDKLKCVLFKPNFILSTNAQQVFTSCSLLKKIAFEGFDSLT
jgi:hypothetical protein